MEKFALPHCHGEGQREEYLRDQLGRPDTFQNVADTFRLLDDTSRVRIFWLLCHCEECVINISAMVDMTSRREGKEVYYRAADTEESRLLHQTIEQIMEISCPVK